MLLNPLPRDLTSLPHLFLNHNVHWLATTSNFMVLGKNCCYFSVSISSSLDQDLHGEKATVDP